jgi:hypothetical protein
MKCCYLEFQPDHRGFGRLVMHNDSLIVHDFPARSGHVNARGNLVDAIGRGIWTGREPPVKTAERAMWIAGPDHGWKYRLWDPRGRWTHFLIHPDGNLPGSMGCIVIQGTDAPELFQCLSKVHTLQSAVPVFIGIDVPPSGDVGEYFAVVGATAPGKT